RFMIISDIVSLLMIEVISDMNLCVLLNYHIACPFPAAQIRFPAFLPRRSENPDYLAIIFFSAPEIRKLLVTDLPLPHTTPPPVSTTCSASFGCS
ncbi:TPA: hypothetical protein ACHWTH_005355, partial [Escherichia coli]